MSNLKFDKPISRTHYYHISITSKYEWGDGWNAFDEKEFRKVMYNALLAQEGFGFYLVEKDFCGACETLHSSNKGTNVYLHPMEFSGYMREDEFNAILDAINFVDNRIARYNHHIVKDCYDISDDEYVSILEANKDFAQKFYDDNIERYGKWDIAFEFVTQNRIPRIGDSRCLCSSDVDIKWFKDNFCNETQE